MRENTRWEVDEPISTPTLRMQISSSSESVRPVEEKKIRPPCSSVSIFINGPQVLRAAPSHSLGQLALEIADVELRPHAVAGAFGRGRLDIFLGYIRVLHPIRDGGAALGNVHR